jgi:hypothetical protein
MDTEWERKTNFLEDQYRKAKSTRDEFAVENKQLES